MVQSLYFNESADSLGGYVVYRGVRIWLLKPLIG